jgi:hypothetical protein
MMPFLFFNNATKRWVVVIASFGLVWADVKWMCLDELQGEVLRPSVDLADIVWTFSTLEDAQHFIRVWWIDNEIER